MNVRLIPDAIGRLYKILPPFYRRKLILTSACVFVMVVVDLVGLGVLLPVLLLVLSDDNVVSNPYVSLLYTRGGFESNLSFTYAVCGFVLLASFTRTLFNTYMQYFQSKRLLEISSYLSLRLYRYYYSKGFLYIKRNNSHKLINNINSIAVNLIQYYFIPFTSLACEAIVIVSILIGLIFFNVYVFLLVLLTFIPISMTYYRFSRSRIKRYGHRLFLLFPMRSRLLQQTFVGYSDMEMSNSFPLCTGRFRGLLDEQGDLIAKNLVLNGSLQRVLELAIVCSVVVLILATRLFTLPSLGIIVGMFALAVYRVLPGIVKSTGNVFMMRGNSFALDLLDEFESDEENSQMPAQQIIFFQHQICFNRICFSYEKDRPVLQNLSFVIRKGEFIGIRGESGSGKSTLFHLLLGFLQPDSGTIQVDNVCLSPEVMVSWHNKIGYVSQQLFMVEGSLLDNIVMGTEDGKPDRLRAWKALQQASLDKFVSGLPEGVDTLIGEGGCSLSGGQRQRLGIARALYKEADILLFDEATSSLDEATEQAINDAILHLADQRTDLTLLVISHRQESLAICRRIVDIEDLQQE